MIMIITEITVKLLRLGMNITEILFLGEPWLISEYVEELEGIFYYQFSVATTAAEED